MNYCKHDIVLYFGKVKSIDKYSICYDRKYICAYCGCKNINKGSNIKKIIDLSHLNIDLNNKSMYKKYYEIRPILNNIIKQENNKNNIKKLVLK